MGMPSCVRHACRHMASDLYSGVVARDFAFIEQDDGLDAQTQETQSGDGETAGRHADGDIGEELPAELDCELENENGGKGGQPAADRHGTAYGYIGINIQLAKECVTSFLLLNSFSVRGTVQASVQFFTIIQPYCIQP